MELIKLFREPRPSRLASSKSLATNGVIKAVDAQSIVPLKDLKSEALQGLGMNLDDEVPLATELERMGKAELALLLLGKY